MCTVVIAAHNEGLVIGACLDALLLDADVGEFEVVVAANGCTDDTAQAAARDGVTVIELTEADKAAALNAAEQVATRYPRIYLDADVRLSTRSVRALRDAVTATPGEAPPALAAMARRDLQLRGRPLPIRAYFAINSHHPAYTGSLFGRGAVALSAEGRARFDQFPLMQADDLFLDSLFAPSEKAEVSEAVSSVATPWRTRDLLQRLERVRRANHQLRVSVGAGSGPAPGAFAGRSDRWAWLREVVVPRPWLAPSAVVYVAITLVAEMRATRQPDLLGWGQDESTRSAHAHS